MTDDDESANGYDTQPRKDGRWKKGDKTPNPYGRKGKPRTPENGAENIFAKALEAPVTLPIGGRKKRHSKLELAAIQLANKAAKGDTPSMKMVMNWMRQEDARKTQTAAAANYVFDQDDLKTIANVVARIRALPSDDDTGSNL